MNSAPKLVNWIAPQKDGQSCIFRYYWVETLPQSVLSSFVDPEKERGGVLPKSEITLNTTSKEIFLLQRKNEKLGKRLGKTTGWIHRKSLEKKNVKMFAGVNYEQITTDGLLISFGEEKKDLQTLKVDSIIICAGQISEISLVEKLNINKINHHIIGGAKLANELDAKSAIDQGCRLAAKL